MKKLFSLALVLGVLMAPASISAAELRRYVVSDLGAVGDGATVNTQAIQAAIDRCAADGGGVLVVPKGTFLSGALYFKQGVNLLVEKDGVLKSTTNMADFPPIYTRWEGFERYWTAAFLNFIGMKNVVISGEGLIDGSGPGFYAGGQRGGGGQRGFAGGTPPGGLPPDDLRQVNDAFRNLLSSDAGAKAVFDKYPNYNPLSNAGVTPPARGRGPAQSAALPAVAEVYPSPLPTTERLNFWGRPGPLPPMNAAGVRLPGGGGVLPPRLLVVQDCADVKVSGLNFLDPARWCVVFIYSNNVLAENLTVRHPSHSVPSSDSMDIDSCRNVHVTGCYLEANDDCLSIKAGKDEDGRRVNRPSENILIEKTHFAYGHGGAAMGSETSGGIRNVTVRDCLVDDDNWAPIRFKSQYTRGGIVENITYENITLNNTRQAFEFNLEWNAAGATGPRVPPTVRNVKIINVHGTVQRAGTLHGLPDSPISNVVFENCEITAGTGLVLENIREVNTAGLTLIIDPNLRANQGFGLGAADGETPAPGAN